MLSSNSSCMGLLMVFVPGFHGVIRLSCFSAAVATEGLPTSRIHLFVAFAEAPGACRTRDMGSKTTCQR